MSNLPIQLNAPIAAPLWPMLWAFAKKQVRDLAQSFIVLLAAYTLVTIFVYVMARSSISDPLRISFGATFFFGCAYALVVNFTAFVSERERRTDQFLAGLPISSSWIGWTKLITAGLVFLTFLLAQALIVTTATWLFATFKFELQVDWYSRFTETKFLLVLLWSLAIFGGTFVCSAVACSLFSNPWVSILAFVGIFVASIYFAMILLSEPADLPPITPWVLTAMTGLAAVGAAFLLGPSTWLRRRAWTVPDVGRALGSVGGERFSHGTSAWSERQTALLKRANQNPGLAMLWQAVCQQAALMVYVPALLSLALFGYLLFFGPSSVIDTPWRTQAHSILLVEDSSGFNWLCQFGITLLGLGLAWVTLFADKRDNNVQFFRQHREHGTLFWLSRVALPIVLLTIVVPILYVFYATGRGFLARVDDLIFIGIASFSATLVWSQVLKSHVYLLGIGFVVSFMMFSNSQIVLDSFSDDGFSPAIYFLLQMTKTLPMIWLLGSLWFAPRWLAGARVSQHPSWMVFIAVTTLMAFAVPLYLLAHLFLTGKFYA